MCQFPGQVPQNRAGPDAPLRDHLPAVRGGERPRSRSHLRCGLQDGCVHADAVTGGESTGGGEPFKGSAGRTAPNLYYNLHLLVLGSLVARLNVNRVAQKMGIKLSNNNKGSIFFINSVVNYD